MAGLLSGFALGLLALSRPVSGGSLKDIEHVIIFMQENRSWNSVGAPIDLPGPGLTQWCSTLEPWLAFVASMIQMSKSTQMDCPFGISKHAYRRQVYTLTI